MDPAKTANDVPHGSPRPARGRGIDCGIGCGIDRVPPAMTARGGCHVDDPFGNRIELVEADR